MHVMATCLMEPRLLVPESSAEGAMVAEWEAAELAKLRRETAAAESCSSPAPPK